MEAYLLVKKMREKIKKEKNHKKQTTMLQSSNWELLSVPISYLKIVAKDADTISEYHVSTWIWEKLYFISKRGILQTI